MQNKEISMIEKRKSIRTFIDKPLSKKDIEKIDQYISNPENMKGPFGNKIQLSMVNISDSDNANGKQIGTYGMIKNAQGFIAGIAQNNRLSLLDFGFVFENLILALTEMEIGTCWLGGTFDRKFINEKLIESEGDIIPCITPIGYIPDRIGIKDKLIRSAIKADNRKKWEEMFFTGTFNEPLSKNKSDIWLDALESVRMAPSASNKQPWRILIDESQKIAHLYLERTTGYGSNLPIDIQIVDMGIAMAHISKSTKTAQIEQPWKINDPGISGQNKEYVASFYL